MIILLLREFWNWPVLSQPETLALRLALRAADGTTTSLHPIRHRRSR